jgi:hypothetical protein
MGMYKASAISEWFDGTITGTLQKSECSLKWDNSYKMKSCVLVFKDICVYCELNQWFECDRVNS